MDIGVTRSGDGLILTLRGEFDLKTAPEFVRTVDEMQSEEISRVVVDLGGVAFIDSSGLGALLGRYRELSSRGVSFSLAAPSHTVREVLGIAGVSRVMDVYPEVQSALRETEEASRLDDEG